MVAPLASAISLASVIAATECSSNCNGLKMTRNGYGMFTLHPPWGPSFKRYSHALGKRSRRDICVEARLPNHAAIDFSAPEFMKRGITSVAIRRIDLNQGSGLSA